MKNKMIKIFGALFLLSTTALIGFSYLVFFDSQNSGNKTIVTIEKNQSVRAIASKLSDEGILQNPWALRVAVKLSGTDKKFRSGTFEFANPSSVAQIIEVLTKGKMVLQEVVIPEGFSMKEIAQVLEKQEITTAQEFLAACKSLNLLTEYDISATTLEGYLFPETYRFAKGTDAETVAQAMVDHLMSKITAEDLTEAATLGLTLHQWITLASIIEKEAGNEQEYRLISSVFHNRLQKKMRLESDPTIIYGIPDYDGNIKKHHIRMDHAYNTYVIKGLPPGPIASPGWGALKAAINPVESEFLFFVADGNKKHIFAKTYPEHEQNVQKYQIRKNK